MFTVFLEHKAGIRKVLVFLVKGDDELSREIFPHPQNLRTGKHFINEIFLWGNKRINMIVYGIE